MFSDMNCKLQATKSKRIVTLRAFMMENGTMRVRFKIQPHQWLSHEFSLQESFIISKRQVEEYSPQWISSRANTPILLHIILSSLKSRLSFRGNSTKNCPNLPIFPSLCCLHSYTFPSTIFLQFSAKEFEIW